MSESESTPEESQQCAHVFRNRSSKHEPGDRCSNKPMRGSITGYCWEHKKVPIKSAPAPRARSEPIAVPVSTPTLAQSSRALPVVELANSYR